MPFDGNDTQLVGSESVVTTYGGGSIRNEGSKWGTLVTRKSHGTLKISDRRKLAVAKYMTATMTTHATP
jgi:hypothetical protein